jgi:hypothetical protein
MAQPLQEYLTCSEKVIEALQFRYQPKTLADFAAASLRACFGSFIP